MIGMHTFGASAPLKELLTKFGFTPEKVVEAAKDAARRRSVAERRAARGSQSSIGSRGGPLR